VGKSKSILREESRQREQEKQKISGKKRKKSFGVEKIKRKDGKKN
jgi:hypothetical protein